MTYKTMRIQIRDKYLRNGARSRNRTGTTVKSQDFKSCVSTNFTIRAKFLFQLKQSLNMEARVGIEPAYTELQSVCFYLCLNYLGRIIRIFSLNTSLFYQNVTFF